MVKRSLLLVCAVLAVGAGEVVGDEGMVRPLKILGATRVPAGRMARFQLSEAPARASVEWDVVPYGLADVEEAGPQALVTAPPGSYLLRVRLQFIREGGIVTRRAEAPIVFDAGARELVECDPPAVELEEPVQFIRRPAPYARPPAPRVTIDVPSVRTAPAPYSACEPPPSTFGVDRQLRFQFELRETPARRPLLFRAIGGEPARRETRLRIDGIWP